MEITCIECGWYKWCSGERGQLTPPGTLDQFWAWVTVYVEFYMLFACLSGFPRGSQVSFHILKTYQWANCLCLTFPLIVVYWHPMQDAFGLRAQNSQDKLVTLIRIKHLLKNNIWMLEFQSWLPNNMKSFIQITGSLILVLELNWICH